MSTEFKVRCFICRGKERTHGNSRSQRDLLDSLEQKFLSGKNSANSASPEKASPQNVKSLSLSKRQESFYMMRDLSANIGVKLAKQFSE